ncbi:polysaccharide biosynthesis tyrosine autokinase [Aeromicrobium duanguangcaii]|uniref:non-specific protein-tyrosine kinase n=1 Tax=Aeromicrobium duanguangcaii TaxID=2968086 RepID=A0ABY5KLD3_9ACTN|nr:polysaccharide biosynthesis tyrosine autokinase [Aeromicrobium duanguangcaii]MCD9153794.1 polysaccharide biosynthesis tyrosine autokinase [Aeromicrobium duanguangcaii]UUI69128.1 polysaccharide biosynthesis tyrosine autokinase [Aeromicrobium duanguangcaii]
MQFLRVLVKHWALVVIPFLLCVLGTFVFSKQATPLYTASASSYFTLPVGQSGTDLFQGANYTQQQLGSYAQLASTPLILDPVIEDLGLDTTPRMLKNRMTVSVVPDSVLITVAVEDEDPDRAAAIANRVTKELATATAALAPRLGNGKPAISATTVAKATPPEGPSSPNTKRNILAGALVGLFLGVLLALARELLDTRVRSAEDLPEGLPVLAEVERGRVIRPGSGDQSHKNHAQFILDEALRRVKTSLRFIDVERPARVIALSSSISGEGKTSLAIQFARVLSEGSGAVLLIEADLRRPRIASRLGVDSGIGLSDVLAGSVSVEQAAQSALTPGLSVLTSGSAVPNPAELLASQAMGSLLASLRMRYEYIVIDAPPVLPVTDASVLATQVDGTLLVARYGKVTRAQLATAVETLRQVDARLLGVVINAAPGASRRRAKHATYWYATEH